MTAPATPATLADRFRALSGEQRIRLMRRLTEAGRAHEIPAVVPPRETGRPVRLSPAQQDLWVYESLYPGTPALNLCAAYHFGEPVEPAALAAVLTRLQTDHDVLRTRITTGASGDPEVSFPDDGPFVVEHEDLRGTPTTIHQAFRTFRRRPFDLEGERLVRARFVRVDETRCTLMLSLHHIITDWWSFDVLQAEFATAYAAVRAGREPAPARPPVQYADFAGWQGELEESGVYDARLAFWRDYLAAPPGPLTVPGAGAPAAERGEDGIVQVPFRVGPDTTRAVRALARERGASVYTVLMAAFAVLAHRVSGAGDLVLGTPVANRSAQGLDKVIGYVMNAVPTRWRVRPGDTFAGLLTGFAADFPALMANADLPVGRIVSAAAPERSTGRSPLFQWVFMHLTQQRSITAVREFATPERIHTGGEHDLVGVVRDSGDGMDGSFEVRTDVLSPAAVARWAECYLELLDRVTAAPDTALGDLDMVPAAMRHALLAAGEGPAAPAPVTLPGLVADRARRTPHAPAIDDGRHVLTYAGLTDRVDRLAARLTRHGAGPGTLVALALPRGTGWPVAALAVQRAGAACLPLDADHPPARLRAIVAATRPVLLLTAPGTALPDLGTPRLETDPGPGAPAADDAPLTTAPGDPRRPAHVIHTSGSTGTPKGVVVPHTGIAALARTLVDRLGLDPTSRVLQLGAPTFDISVGELCMAFGSGGTLVLPPPGPLVGEDLARVLEDRAVTCVLLPPSVLATVPDGRCPALRTVAVGAEACPPALAARWSTGGRRFHNAYGPTEATVAATVSGPLTPDGTPPPIGSPLHGASLRILDGRLRPVPAGVTGEVYLASTVLLADGYLGRPGRTAQCFVADPWGPPGARMYRTGDLAHRDEDGTTHYAGRRDEQLKLRGLRVEPGEIESALAGHPGVDRAAVAVRHDTAGRPRLIAWAVPRPGHTLEPAALLEHAAAALPAALVPADAVVLETLPLTTGGKLDRAALPAPAARPADAARPPATAAEERLCALFAEVLGIDAPGADEDFFRLGGDSIMAIQLAARSCAAGLVIAPRDVFTDRTPARLAALAAAPDTAPGAGEPDDTGEPLDGPLPLTPVMRWWRGLGPVSGAFTQSMAFPLPPGTGEARIRAALAALLRRHDALRLRLLPGDDPERALEVTPPGEAAPVRTIRIPVPAGQDPLEHAHRAARETVLAPGDGEMLRAGWLDAGPGRPGLLALTVHHLAVDGVSWRVLGPELATALTGDDLTALPAPTPYARWLRRLARDAARAGAELPYWERQLTGPDARLRPAGGSGERETVTVELPADLTHRALTTLPAAFNCGPDAVLLTALATAAARRGHGTDLLVDLEGHGRDGRPGHPDVSRTVGWFTSRYPVRLEPGPAGGDRAEALKRVKETLRAVPSGGLGWGLLRHLDPVAGPRLAALATPDVGFNYLGRFTGGDVSGGQWLETAENAVPLGHTLQVDALAHPVDGELRLETTFSYAPGVLTGDEVRDLAARWQRELTALAEHGTRTGVTVLTPSDFPLAGLTQDQLAALEGDMDFDDDFGDDLTDGSR